MESILSILGILLTTSIVIIVFWYYKYIKPITNKQHQQTEFEEQTKLIADIREAVTLHILNTDTSIFSAIAKQKVILNANKRKAIAIFLSSIQFKNILTAILGTTEYSDELVETLITLNVPVAYIGDLPVHVSSLLIDAPVFVVGSIKWELDD